MKIIKEGDKSRLHTIIRFECDKCGCVFEADETEYKTGYTDYYCTFVSCDCPTCGKKTTQR